MSRVSSLHQGLTQVLAEDSTHRYYQALCNQHVCGHTEDTDKLRIEGHLVAEYCRLVKPLDREVVNARGQEATLRPSIRFSLSATPQPNRPCAHPLVEYR